MNITQNKNQPFQLRVEIELPRIFRDTYLEKILKMKGWEDNCINNERASILLQSMVVLENQHKKNIAYDFDWLWSMMFHNSRAN